MPISISHQSWVVLGLVLVVLGVLLVRWAARNNMVSVVTDATTGAVFSKLRKGGALEVPDEIKARYDDVMAEGSTVGRAKKLAGYTVRHAVSQVAGVGGGLLIVAGLLAAALGVFYG